MLFMSLTRSVKKLFYYAKEDGQLFCEPMFTYCTRISEAGTAIVKYDEKLCVLELKPEPIE